MPTKEEYQKSHQELNPEEIAGKMSQIMMVMIKHTTDTELGLTEYMFAMESMSKEEMAYVVCAHAAFSIEDSIKQIPPLKKMIEAMKEAEAFEHFNKSKP